MEGSLSIFQPKAAPARKHSSPREMSLVLDYDNDGLLDLFLIEDKFNP
jgi:hypothetical protein